MVNSCSARAAVAACASLLITESDVSAEDSLRVALILFGPSSAVGRLIIGVLPLFAAVLVLRFNHFPASSLSIYQPFLYGLVNVLKAIEVILLPVPFVLRPMV